jgi:hypothetical protein
MERSGGRGYGHVDLNVTFLREFKKLVNVRKNYFLP